MTSNSTRLAVTAAVAAIGALTVPASASATVTPEVVGDTLTVSSDGAGDTIALAAAGGFITVNGAPTALAADDDAQIVVNAGGGNDTVDASALAAAAYGDLELNGGDGEDILTGGIDNDALNGDVGDDRLIGFRGTDRASGGDGNDVMVWNNGDGTDTNDGNGGNDEVEVNGAPTVGDVFIAKPGAQPGRVQFNRINLGTFGIDLVAERLTVNGLGGDDSFAPDPAVPAGLAGLTSVTLNGGTGADTLTGGDGADAVNGGDGTDALDGGSGDDRVAGDRGADAMRGGAGDDALVWNNGDGSDDNVGGDGFDRVEVNGAAAGDLLTLGPDGGQATFARTNLVPFELGISADTEAVALASGGGGDAFTVAPGLPEMIVAVDGGPGNDELTGAEEADSFFGGPGNDTVTPGPGSDLADGGADGDQLFSRDGAGDLVRGGTGFDFAETDATTVDATSGIEAHDALPGEDTAALLPELGVIEVVRRHGRLIARVPARCPAAEAGGCRTTLMLETAKPVRLGDVRAVLVLGSKTSRLDAGERGTIRVRLARGTAGLAERGRLAARVRVASSDAAGNLAKATERVVLHIPNR